MKLLTWNVNHRTKEKPIPPHMAKAIASLEPDFVVLTEFVDGFSRKNFFEELKKFGYTYNISNGADGQNHILIAAKIPLIDGDIKAPVLKVTNSKGKEQETTALPSNVFHVKVPKLDFDILGIRIPDYSKQPLLRKACWNWLLETAANNKDKPFVIMGDFNADPDPRKSPAYFSKCLEELMKDKWQGASPKEGGSYWTIRGGMEKRLDHIFLSTHFSFRNPEYRTESGQYIFAKKPVAMSDHAVLLVDADLKL
jgi:endonuclease/exonuclease/phosphatase family metal-dependent hydrolase